MAIVNFAETRRRDMESLIMTSIAVQELVDLIATEVEARIKIKEYPKPLPDRINLQEAMVVLGLKRSAVYKLTMSKAIPFKKYGKSLVFSRRELEAWKERRTVRRLTPDEMATDHLAKVASNRARRAP